MPEPENWKAARVAKAAIRGLPFRVPAVA